MDPPQQPPSPSTAAGVQSTSLYVGDLEANVSEAQLYEIFSQIGPVVSIRVCRDLVTRRSLGYAYVNFNTADDAMRAINLLNFTMINGRLVRIMFSHRDPTLRKSGTANIYIKNLDKSIDHKALYDTFNAFGAIVSCKVATDANGESKGYGFVQYETDEAAKTAIEKVNGMLLSDRQVYVGPFVRRQDRDNGSNPTKFTNLYVKNLDASIGEEELRAAFEEFGAISSLTVAKDADGKSKGFGFVNFEVAEDAASAVEGLNGKKIGEKEWQVSRAQKKSEREQELRNKMEADRKERMDKYRGVNLYLKNLDDAVDDEKLTQLFSEFGTITSCKVMKDDNGMNKGIGFVAFSSPEEATRAVTEMNGKMVGSKPIYVALAQRKEERKQMLQAQFQHRVGGPSGPMSGPGSIPLYHPATAAMAQQMFFGPGIISPQNAGYGYQQPLVAMRPGMNQNSAPNFYPPHRPGQMQRMGNRRGGAGSYLGPAQRGNRGGGMLGVPRGQIMMPPPPNSIDPSAPDTVPHNMPIATLASILASAPPDQRRMILGERLYPLVDAVEHENAGKVTGMILEMDQNEVLHLIQSPEALNGKIQEAREVLRMASQQTAAVTGQMSNLALNE